MDVVLSCIFTLQLCIWPEWTEDDLRNARVDVYVDSKLRKSVRGFDGIILDSLSKQHFNETNVMIRSKSRRSDPPLTHVEGKC